jgi:pimeloyl-ACP methyl ester carboxylesterase
VVASLATGLLAATALVSAPFVAATEDAVTGAILLGFGLGWALLAVLSRSFSAPSQGWAWVPALFQGVSGLALLVAGEEIRPVLNWVWPPALLAVAVLTAVGVRRHLRGRSRWLLSPVVAILVLASVGGAVETVGEALDARAHPMPGRLIDVGDHSLHLSCTGTGSPTVVLEPGAGEMSSNLGWIAPAVAAKTRVCLYDRAGRGWSEPAEGPQDGARLASDLHTLLHQAQVPAPYVLAGHSFGGLYVLGYAAQYPEDVAGMVLVDSTAPTASDAGAAAPDVTTAGLVSKITATLSIAARVGLGRLYGLAAFDSLPPRSRDEVRASLATATSVRSSIDEFVQASAAMVAAGSLKTLGDKPLVVLTAGVGSDPAHVASQRRLATLSTNSEHRTVDGAVHEALVADQGPAAVTTQSILDVVSAVRSGQPLVA